jgi:Ser/Thr protein kinase RdoA (MazF antagonist)
VGSLPRQLGHYDYHPHNLLFDSRNKLTAILDFDLMRVSQRARDVALAMHKLARVYGSQTEAKLDIGATILDRATDFLSAYQQLFPLAKHEVISMPHLLRDEVIRKIAYLCMTKNSLDRYSLQELKKQETQFWETMEFGSLWSRMLKYENK